MKTISSSQDEILKFLQCLGLLFVFVFFCSMVNVKCAHFVRRKVDLSFKSGKSSRHWYFYFSISNSVTVYIHTSCTSGSKMDHKWMLFRIQLPSSLLHMNILAGYLLPSGNKYPAKTERGLLECWVVGLSCCPVKRSSLSNTASCVFCICKKLHFQLCTQR